MRQNTGILYILTWKCASRHSGVQFFNISTSKSGPNMQCFVHFDLEMCFSPQQRAIFQHLNFKKWSGADVFCTFSRHSGVQFFNISTSKSGPNMQCFVHFDLARHNGVQFFNISTSESGLRMSVFYHFDLETCFSPQRRAIFDFSSDHMTPHPPL